jgi:hypothetical protein
MVILMLFESYGTSHVLHGSQWPQIAMGYSKNSSSNHSECGCVRLNAALIDDKCFVCVSKKRV